MGSLNTEFATSNACRTGTAICFTPDAVQLRDLGIKMEAACQTFLYVPLRFLAALRDLGTNLPRRGLSFFAADRRLALKTSQVVAERRPMP
jgi:hypothetical protein